MSGYLRKADEALEAIRAAGRFRELQTDRPKCAADFSTNDYLALSADSRMVEAMRHVKAVGSGGARLLGGRHREHYLLEQEIAAWVGRERALLFSSGYMAALGAVQVLSGLCGSIYSDALNHASLIDGIRASKKPREVYEHLRLPSRELRRPGSLIVSESLFGMDGDVADVPAILAQLGDDDVLLLDEAHALGVVGPQGAGAAHGMDDDRIVVLGTLSKAVGAAGGFIAGPAALVELLINQARTFIFDTALPPALAFAARVGIMLARGADDRRERLTAKVLRLHAGLRELHVPVPAGVAPIVPVFAGDELDALRLMERCLERGVYAPAVRPPTVPPGTSRLRLSLRADHTNEQIDLFLEQLACSVT